MRFALALLIAATMPGAVSAADPPVPDYLIFERSTPLHKVLASGDEGLYVAVNSRAILDEKALAKELKEHADKGPRIVFHLVKEGNQDEGEVKRLHDRLKRLAKECGFANPGQSTLYIGSYDWAKETAVARKAIAEKRTGDETGRGDGGVRVYPVRTPLSVHQSKDSQVVVDVSPEAMQDLIGLEERIRSLMKEQELEPKGRVRFLTRVRNDDSPTRDSHDDRIKTIATSLGFDESTVTTSFD